MSFPWAQTRHWAAFFPFLLPLGIQTHVAQGEAWHSGKQKQTERTAKKHPATTHDESLFSPLSPIRIFRPNSNVEIAFDVRTRTPLYVLQRLSLSMEHASADKNKGKRRRYNFFEEAALPEHFRSRNSHYHHSGFDRGHLAPAADFHDQDHASSTKDSYNLINAAPQHPELNRKLWAQLEEWTRNVARSCSKEKGNSQETFVVTGPLWLPERKVGDREFEYRYPGLGVPPSLLAVPTHFFKVVVVVETANNSLVDQKSEARIAKFACFVIPNDDSSSGAAWANGNRSRSSLQDYLVCWRDLEAVSGLTFFPTLASDEWKAKSTDATNTATGKRNKYGRGEGRHILQLADSTEHQPMIDRGGRNRKKKNRVDGNFGNVQHLCREHSCMPPYKNREASED